MELYQLKTFIMVAEEGHLTRAAKRLNASQPAISAHIKALEDELGLILFQRTPKGMILTPEGEKLQQHAYRALEVVDTIASEAEKMRGVISGDIRIGVNTEPESVRIPELFPAIKTDFPKLHLHILQSNSGELAYKLDNNLLDAGFLYGNAITEKMYSLELEQLKMVVAGPAQWRDKLENSAPEDLGQFPWIITPTSCPFHTLANRLFEKYDIQPQQVALVDQESVIKTMIKAGVGISLILEREVLEEGHEEIAVWDYEELYLKLSIACLQRRKDEPMLQALFSTITKIWEPNPVIA